MELVLHPRGGSGSSGVPGHGGQWVQGAVPTSHPPWGTHRGLWGSESPQPSLVQLLAASAGAKSASGSSSGTQPEGKEAKP